MFYPMLVRLRHMYIYIPFTLKNSRYTIMAKFADVHCPNCGHRGALVLKEDIIDPDTKNKYDEVQCDSCGQIFRVEHS